MPLDLLPTAVYLVCLAWFLLRNRGRAIVQVYAIIVACYLNIFPAADYLLSSGEGMESFASFQFLIIYFFEIPLLIMLSSRHRPQAQTVDVRRMRLSLLLPFTLAGMLGMFWYVCVQYDMLFLRLLQQTDVPTLPLYLYRATLETSFFVILFLAYSLTASTTSSPNYRLYQLMLLAYLGTFIVYFALNSRMQLLLLLILLIATRPRITLPSRARAIALGTLAAGLIVGQTLVRELYFEETDRVETGQVADVATVLGSMIARRLDSLWPLYDIGGPRFDLLNGEPFNWLGFRLSGYQHVLTLNWSFFFDRASYVEIRDSLVTSPSVAIYNDLLGASEIDFPKSMIIDMVLSFGAWGLVLAAVLLGSIATRIQTHSRRFGHFDARFLTAIYTLPLLLQFEKEFIGFLISWLKWSPFLVMLIVLSHEQNKAQRPRTRV